MKTCSQTVVSACFTTTDLATNAFHALGSKEQKALGLKPAHLEDPKYRKVELQTNGYLITFYGLTEEEKVRANG